MNKHRDEFVQFAKLNADIAPIVFKAKENLAKENEAKSLAKKKKQQHAKDREAGRATEKPLAPPKELTEEEKFKLVLEEGLQEEAAKRKKRAKAAAKRRVKREKAWLYAHQHMYVKMPGEIPYCVVCRERSDINWLEKQQEAEQKAEETFESNLEARKPSQEAHIRDTLEKAHIEKMEAMRLKRLEIMEKAKADHKASIAKALQGESEGEGGAIIGSPDSKDHKIDGGDSTSSLAYMVRLQLHHLLLSLLSWFVW